MRNPPISAAALMCVAAMASMPRGGAFLAGPACVPFGRPSVRLCAAGARPAAAGLRGARASASGGIEQEVQKMRAADIKEELFKRGISYAGLFEKSELVAKLVMARESERQAGQEREREASAQSRLTDQLCSLGGFRVPLSRLMAREGTLGADVRIDEKDYFAVRAAFPDLNADDAEFILDSAASNSVVTPQWAGRTGAKPTGLTASVSGGTAGGGGAQQLSLGALQIKSDDGMKPCGMLDAVALEIPVPSSVGGLLGLDFLSRFDVYVNFEGARPHAVFLPSLSACSQDDSAAGFGASGLRGRAVEALRGSGLAEAPLFYLSPPAGLYYCKVQLQSGDTKSPPIAAVVDMGSTFTIINSQAAAAVGIQEGSPLLRSTDQVVSGAAMPGQGYVPVRVKELDARIRIGGMAGQGAIDLGQHCCCVADLSSFSQLGLGTAPAMILGACASARARARACVYDPWCMRAPAGEAWTRGLIPPCTQRSRAGCAGRPNKQQSRWWATGIECGGAQIVGASQWLRRLTAYFHQCWRLPGRQNVGVNPVQTLRATEFILFRRPGL